MVNKMKREAKAEGGREKMYTTNEKTLYLLKPDLKAGPRRRRRGW